MYEFVILTVFPFAVLFAASMDLVSMTIPNRISIFLVAAFAVLAPFANLSLEQFAWHVAAGLLVFAVTFGLWTVRALGGGDVKFLSAIALWVGFDHLLAYVILAALCGGALAVLMLVFRAMPLPAFMVRQPWIFRLHTPKGGIPYGVALCAGALLVYPQTIWFTRMFA